MTCCKGLTPRPPPFCFLRAHHPLTRNCHAPPFAQCNKLYRLHLPRAIRSVESVCAAGYFQLLHFHFNGCFFMAYRRLERYLRCTGLCGGGRAYEPYKANHYATFRMRMNRGRGTISQRRQQRSKVASAQAWYSGCQTKLPDNTTTSVGNHASFYAILRLRFGHSSLSSS